MSYEIHAPGTRNTLASLRDFYETLMQLSGKELEVLAISILRRMNADPASVLRALEK